MCADIVIYHSCEAFNWLSLGLLVKDARFLGAFGWLFRKLILLRLEE